MVLQTGSRVVDGNIHQAVEYSQQLHGPCLPLRLNKRLNKLF